MEDETNVTVIDSGSWLTKSGQGGTDTPSSFMLSQVGTQKDGVPHLPSSPHNVYGMNAQMKANEYALTSPFAMGEINHIDLAGKLWYEIIYNELKIDPTTNTFLLTDSPFCSIAMREKTVEMFFEDFRVPYFAIYPQTVLSLYSTGRTTGLVTDLGETYSYSMAVVDGYMLKQTTTKSELGGKHLNDFCEKLLKQEKLNYGTIPEVDVPRDIKEKLCYVSTDYMGEMKTFMNSNQKNEIYELPDGHKMHINDILIRVPEILFQPTLMGYEQPGIQKIVMTTIQKADSDIRTELLQNITLVGGTSQFQNIDKRMFNEISDQETKNHKVKVIAYLDRKYASWTGGSVLTSLNTFNDTLISSAEYHEYGSSIVNRKYIF